MLYGVCVCVLRRACVKGSVCRRIHIKRNICTTKVCMLRRVCVLRGVCVLRVVCVRRRISIRRRKGVEKDTTQGSANKRQEQETLEKFEKENNNANTNNYLDSDTKIELK